MTLSNFRVILLIFSKVHHIYFFIYTKNLKKSLKICPPIPK